MFYNAPTDDILIGNGYNSINELPPLNVAGLVALHKGKVEGKHLFLIQSHIGDAKIFSFISYITQDYQNGDAAYIVPMLFSWDSPDTDKFLKPFKILTTHNIAPEHLAFKSGDMAMFFVHINDNYEVNAEGYLGQLFLYYIDNEGNLSLHYDVNIGPQNTSIKSNFPITNIFPIVPPND